MPGKLSYYFSKLFKILLNPPMKNSCNIHKTAKVGPASELNKVEIGRYSYMGSRCFMVKTKIGAFCSIADQVTVGGAEHPLEFVSTSPVFLKGKNILKKNFSCHNYEATKETVIGNDVWIGRNASVKSGVCISTGAVIGTNSMVTKDVGPYEIWAGNPARFIRKRFDDETVEKLLASEWWNYSDEELSKFADYVPDPKSFVNTQGFGE